MPTVAFLEAHGHALPEETSIGVDMRYATAVVALPQASANDWKAVISFPDPRVNGRGGLLFPIEGGQWMLAIGGANGDAPPGDIDGFKAFAASPSHAHDLQRHPRRRFRWRDRTLRLPRQRAPSFRFAYDLPERTAARR